MTRFFFFQLNAIIISMRINKFLAQCNLGSRRKVEGLIKNGEIVVNGKVCQDLGTQINDGDYVKYNGKILRNNTSNIYIALNKPKNYIVSRSDEFGRKTIYELLPEKLHNLKYIGRLDYDSEGLLVLTNDGDFANELTHPKYKLAKTYEVFVEGIINRDKIKALEKGIVIERKKTLPAIVKIIKQNKNNALLSITIYEGRKRQIRLMLQAVECEVKSLIRVKIGNLDLGDIKLGKYKIIQKKDIL